MKLVIFLTICMLITDSVFGGGPYDTPCDADEDCMSMVCFEYEPESLGSCGCTDDSECSDPVPHCVNSQCEECEVDADCNDADMGFCDPNTKECVECISSATCDPDEVCSDMRECVDACTPGGCDPGQFCNTTTDLCEDGCTDQDPCPTGDICNLDDGECVPDCDPVCGAGEICGRDGNCYCDDRHVRVGLICKVSLPECMMNSDCRNKGEVCNEDNLCECPPGKRLFAGRCVGPGHLGGSCVAGRCRGRRVTCNSMNVCVCARGCGPGTVCLKKRRFWK